MRTVDYKKITLLVLTCCFIFSFFSHSAIAECTDFTWAYKANMITPRFASATVVLDNKIYTLCGHEGRLQGVSNEVYDTSTNTWTSLASLPRSDGRYALGAAASDGKIYTFCGENIWGNYGTNTVDMYDPATNSWTLNIATYPLTLADVEAVAANGKIYCIGGSACPGYPTYNNVYEFDPQSRTFTPKASMPSPKSYIIPIAYNNKIYVFGGRNSGVESNEIFIYNISSDSWSIAGSTLRNLDGVGGVIGNKIYILDGSNPEETKKIIEYDPMTDTITQKTPYNEIFREGPFGGVVNGKFYVIGGNNYISETFIPSTEEGTIIPCEEPDIDLVAKSLTPSQTGDPTSANLIVENTSSETQLSVDINLIASVCGQEVTVASEIADLSPGETTIPISFDLGTYFSDQPVVLYAKVDAGNFIDEVNEDNNEVGTIVTVGNVTPDQLEIITSRAFFSEYCNNCVATFSGNSVYKLADGEEACFDYPVKEGDVSYELVRVSDNEIIQTGSTKTTVTGDWSLQVSLPNDPGSNYEISIQVTDHTLVEDFESTFTLVDCPDGCGGGIPTPPYTPPVGPGPGPQYPPEQFDAWVDSSDIQFSNNTPIIGETITISGIVHANNSYSGIPITWKATYPSGGTVNIAPTRYYDMNGDLFVSTSFTPYVNGDITIEIEIGPGFSDADNTNNAATRVLEVGCLLDHDCDGYQAPDDCNDSNPAINLGAAELCDGIDNNCNNSVDENFNVNAPCSDGEGECYAEGVFVCTPDGSGTECNAVPGQPSPEMCDGKDNDCDSSIVDDGTGEAWYGQQTFCGVGACAATGNLICQLGVQIDTCQPGTPAAELCDGLDNDCDSQTDEDLGSTTCGIGECQRTVANCVNGIPQECIPDNPTTEICDNSDNDCDGSTDEDLGSTTCGLGICQRTVANCINGIPQQCTPGDPMPEVCDLLDNDCDGSADEELGTTTCGLGICEHTIAKCVNGEIQICDPMQGATDELCDNYDNDCDGLTDEENAIGCIVYYRDNDGDVYGETLDYKCLCTPTGNYTTMLPGDCDDTDAEVNPGMEEVSNNFKDDDCNPATPDNMNPIANAGLDQTIHAGMSVTLDGSGSYDPEGNYSLSYAWEITFKPLFSSAELNDPTSANPSFLADMIGFYVIQLVVTDSYGASSVADEVLVNTFISAPTADAGPDQAIIVIGTVVQLDGGKSYDLDGDPITYAWTITSKPVGSAATLSNPFAPNPTFTADIHGEYVIELVVWDIFLWPSEPDTVTISFENIKPVADAGVNQSVVMSDIVYLDGSGSNDANNDPLTFNWSIVSKPEGSLAEIVNPSLPQTSFIADMPGEYIVSLVVNDGFVDSDPSNFSWTVVG